MPGKVELNLMSILRPVKHAGVKR